MFSRICLLIRPISLFAGLMSLDVGLFWKLSLWSLIKGYVSIQFKEWSLIYHPNKIDWTWTVSMFRNINQNFSTALSWENCKWHFKMDDYYKMIVSKNFSHLIEIKFRCLKLTTWQPSGLGTIAFTSDENSYFPSPFWETNEFNEIMQIFKMTEDAFSFLGHEILNNTQMKTPRNGTGWNEEIYLPSFSFVDYFLK